MNKLKGVILSFLLLVSILSSSACNNDKQILEKVQKEINNKNYIGATELLITVNNIIEKEELLTHIAEGIIESCSILDAWDFFELTGRRDAVARMPSPIAVSWNSITVGLKNNGGIVVAGGSGSSSDTRAKQLVNVSNAKQVTVALNTPVVLTKDSKLIVITNERVKSAIDSSLNEINSISSDANNGNIVCVTNAGGVLATGEGISSQILNEVSNWSDVIQAGLTYDEGIVIWALKKDGSILQTNKSSYLSQAEKWKDLVSIDTSSGSVVGLDVKGQLHYVGFHINIDQVEGWKDIVQVSAAMNHTVGLMKDGTVVACGSNDYGQCNVSQWDNIVFVYADDDRTYGIRKDGSLVTVGKEKSVLGGSSGLIEARRWNIFE